MCACASAMAAWDEATILLYNVAINCVHACMHACTHVTTY